MLRFCLIRPFLGEMFRVQLIDIIIHPTLLTLMLADTFVDKEHTGHTTQFRARYCGMGTYYSTTWGLILSNFQY